MLKISASSRVLYLLMGLFQSKSKGRCNDKISIICSLLPHLNSWSDLVKRVRCFNADRTHQCTEKAEIMVE